MNSIITLIVFVVSAAISCPSGWHKFQHDCYFTGKNEMNFVDARIYCYFHNANLLSIHSDEQNEFIVRLMRQEDIDYIWLNGQQQSIQSLSFVWLDGTEFNYANWNPTEPNGFNKNTRNCIYLEPDGQWSDSECSTDENTPLCAMNKKSEAKMTIRKLYYETKVQNHMMMNKTGELREEMKKMKEITTLMMDNLMNNMKNEHKNLLTSTRKLMKIEVDELHEELKNLKKEIDENTVNKLFATNSLSMVNSMMNETKGELREKMIEMNQNINQKKLNNENQRIASGSKANEGRYSGKSG